MEACTYLLDCSGRVVVIGMGKSGHIGSKIAATMASTGTPAFFVHPAEASHGDLGMIKSQDVVLALSNSGETDEVNIILPVSETHRRQNRGNDRQPGFDPGQARRCPSQRRR